MLLKIKSTLTASQSSLAKEKGKKKKIDSLEIDTRIETRALFFLEIKSIGILDVSRATKPTYRRFNFHLAHRHTHTHTHTDCDIGSKKIKKNEKRGATKIAKGIDFFPRVVVVLQFLRRVSSRVESSNSDVICYSPPFSHSSNTSSRSAIRRYKYEVAISVTEVETRS